MTLPYLTVPLLLVGLICFAAGMYLLASGSSSAWSHPATASPGWCTTISYDDGKIVRVARQPQEIKVLELDGQSLQLLAFEDWGFGGIMKFRKGANEIIVGWAASPISCES